MQAIYEKGNLPANLECFSHMPKTKYSKYLPQNFVVLHRITRWIDEEENRIKATAETSLQYVIMDMSGE